MRWAFTLMAGAVALSAFVSWHGRAVGPVGRVPKPTFTVANKSPLEVAYFAGGCFWGVEAVYDRVRGVKSAVSGYAGGYMPRPTYSAVSTGATGHAETVRVTFDPRRVSYGQLLQVYFSVVADPTQLNRQGPDTGPHYRTAFFPTSKAQAVQARAYIDQLRRLKIYRRPIVTKIEPFTGFTDAEPYHQNYLVRHPNQPYIVINDKPKVEALRRHFPDLWRP